MNSTRNAALLVGTALGAVAVLAAPVAAQAAPAPAAPAKAHTTIAGWGHNQSGGMPVQIHGNSITRHLTVKPGGVRTLEVNDATCIVTPGGQSQCSSKVLEGQADFDPAGAHHRRRVLRFRSGNQEGLDRRDGPLGRLQGLRSTGLSDARGVRKFAPRIFAVRDQSQTSRR